MHNTDNNNSENDLVQLNELNQSSHCEYAGQFLDITGTLPISQLEVVSAMGIVNFWYGTLLPDLGVFISSFNGEFNGANLYGFRYCTTYTNPYDQDNLTVATATLLVPVNDNPDKTNIDLSELALEIAARGTTLLRSAVHTVAIDDPDPQIDDVIFNAFIELIMLQNEGGIAVALADGIGLGFPYGYPDNFPESGFEHEPLTISDFIENPYTLSEEDVFHPYQVEESMANTQIDMAKAVPSVIDELNETDYQDNPLGLSGKVVLNGYSAGGGATMAAAKHMQEDDFIANSDDYSQVIALASAGAYDMSGAQMTAGLESGYPVNYYGPYLLKALSLHYEGAFIHLEDGEDGTFPVFNEMVMVEIPDSLGDDEEYWIQIWLDENEDKHYNDFVSEVLTSGFFSGDTITNYLPDDFLDSLSADCGQDTTCFNRVSKVMEEQNTYNWIPAFKVHTCSVPTDPVVVSGNTEAFLDFNLDNAHVSNTYVTVPSEIAGIDIHGFGAILCAIDTYNQIQEFTSCPELGDVNEDGYINVIDVVSIVNFILGTSPDNDLCFYNAADYNQDGFINVIDIVAIVNVILMPIAQQDLMDGFE